MKLCQGQVWKSGKEYIRIVKLERLAVEYKSMPNLGNKEGALHQTSLNASRGQMCRTAMVDNMTRFLTRALRSD